MNAQCGLQLTQPIQQEPSELTAARLCPPSSGAVGGGGAGHGTPRALSGARGLSTTVRTDQTFVSFLFSFFLPFSLPPSLPSFLPFSLPSFLPFLLSSFLPSFLSFFSFC